MPALTAPVTSPYVLYQVQIQLTPAKFIAEWAVYIDAVGEFPPDGQPQDIGNIQDIEGVLVQKHHLPRTSPAQQANHISSTSLQIKAFKNHTCGLFEALAAVRAGREVPAQGGRPAVRNLSQRLTPATAYIGNDVHRFLQG